MLVCATCAEEQQNSRNKLQIKKIFQEFQFQLKFYAESERELKAQGRFNWKQ